MRYPLVGILVGILLSGCAKTKTVMVPVSSCPEPPPISMPILQVDSLQKDSDTDVALHALAEDYVTMKAELKRLIILLEAYRKKPVQ